MNNLIFYDCDAFSHDPQKGILIDFAFYLVDERKMLSDHPYTMKSITDIKRLKVSFNDQKENGLSVQKKVVEFWQSLSKNDLNRISPKKDDYTIDQFVNSVIKYLNTEPKIDYSVVNNKSIQPLFLENLFKISGKNIIEHFPINRCIDFQSYIFAKMNTNVYDFTPVDDEKIWERFYNKNDCVWDVLFNVLKYQAIIRAENDLENIQR